MTSLIRSTRLAAEPRSVPISPPPSASPERKAQGAGPVQGVQGPGSVHGLASGQGPASGQGMASGQGHGPASAAGSAQGVGSAQSQAQAQAAGSGQGAGPVHGTASVPGAGASYEEYKTRFAGELAQLRQQLLDSSREQGLQQGRLAAETEYRRQLETLRALIESVQTGRARYVQDIADDAGEIVFAVVTKMLGEGYASKQAVTAAVREAIRQYKERGRLTIRVAPQDLELLQAKRREWLDGTGAGEVDLIADEQVQLGGCVLEGASGNLDARLETQLERLKQVLVAARQSWRLPQ